MSKEYKRLEEKEKIIEETTNEEIQITEKEFMETLMEEVNNKTLNVIGAFDDDLVRYVKTFANNVWFYEEDECRVIQVNITSYGGQTDALFAIISILENLRELWDCKFTGIINGYAMSCGAILWLWCDNRYMNKYDECMIHQISYGWDGTLEDHERELRRTQIMQKKINNIICEKTPLTEKELKVFYRKGDVFLNRDDCLKLGLITLDEEDDR